MHSTQHLPKSASTRNASDVAMESPLCTDGSWYAIRVRSKFETIACSGLRGKGYEPFLPTYRSKRRWSDRVKELELPIFPGYLFCRFDINDRLLPILTTPGVVAIVGSGKTPVAIDDHEIAAIQLVLRSGLPSQPWPYLCVGSRVYIDAGPLAGVEGIITSDDKVDRLVVSVNLLQRSVAAEIDREWVRPFISGTCPRSVAMSEHLCHIARAG